MKNWIKFHIGYIYAIMCFFLSFVGFGSLLIAEGMIEIMLCFVCGTLDLVLCSYAIINQRDQNKEALILEKTNFDFENQVDYSKIHKLENKIR